MDRVEQEIRFITHALSLLDNEDKKYKQLSQRRDELLTLKNNIDVEGIIWK